MAAPFIVPSTDTICCAASRWRFSSAFEAPSSERATLATCVPACLTAWPAATRPTRAVRRAREVGIWSRAMLYILGAPLAAPGG